MSLKDEVRWVHEAEFYDDITDIPAPVRKSMKPVLPIEALRAWLEEQHTSIVGKATVAAMLAELEGLS